VAKPKGRVRQDRGLVDKTIMPEKYVPPPESECKTQERHYTLDSDADGEPTDRLVTEFLIHNRKTVRFAVNQLTFDGGKWITVWRMDTWHSEVHYHQFYRNKDEKREVLYEIPAQDGATIITKAFTEANTMMKTEWAPNLERWRNG
jgi:hypothetical protein